MTNERPTPETDAFTTSFISIDDPEGNKRWVPSEFARVLERERDEARNNMADALQEVDLRALDFERMKQERDEAREQLANLEEIILGEWPEDQAAELIRNAKESAK